MSETNTQSPLVAGDRSKGAAYIAAHPEEYGFIWGSGPIGKGTGSKYVELKADCPWIDVTPTLLPLFILTWGAALVSKGLGGTSIKVQCDRVNRGTLKKNHSVSVDTLKVKNVTSILLGVIVRGFSAPVTKYVVAGQVFTSQADADKFTANAERIRQLEAARSFLAMAAENGIDYTLARNMAKAQYPLAFDMTTPPHIVATNDETVSDVDPSEEQDEDEDDEDLNDEDEQDDDEE